MKDGPQTDNALEYLTPVLGTFTPFLFLSSCRDKASKLAKNILTTVAQPL